MKKIYVILVTLLAVISLSFIITQKSTADFFFDANIEALAADEINLGRMCAYGAPGTQPYISCSSCRLSTFTIVSMGFCNKL